MREGAARGGAGAGLHPPSRERLSRSAGVPCPTDAEVVYVFAHIVQCAADASEYTIVFCGAFIPPFTR